MQKQIADKKIIICICAAVAVIAAVVGMLLLNKEESYRSILVYEVEGTASIERAGVGNMNAAENLYLESDDRVTVAQESSMRMKLDNDKYVMAEADTIFSVEAEGTDENSKTRIRLEQGAVTNEIQHPLSEGSQYETSTPNSVMAVRGTIYRAEIYIDDNGEKNTKLCCFQGKVGTTPILPDGTYGEEVLVPAGSELIIYSDGTVDDLRDIAYEELPEQALNNLRSMSESGQSMTGITLKDLMELTEKIDNSGNTAEVNEESGESEPEQTALSDTKEDSEYSDIDEDTADAAAARNTAGNASTRASRDVKDSGTAQTAADQPNQPEQKPQTAQGTQPKAAETADSVSSGNDNAGGDSSSGGNGGGDSDNNNQPEHDVPNYDIPSYDVPEINYPVIPPQPVTYTVTFEYQGTVFATQEVKSGERASEPLLIPAENGEWDFDFRTGIKANTTIKWKE
ncbi:MAG: FecR domain-containing protein [Lachnospiraceae bacterium]|nr:FecR domain-containing protein [Lachnospiraceae bacterium]